MRVLLVMVLAAACTPAQPKPTTVPVAERGVTRAEMGTMGMKQLEITDLLHQHVLVLDKQVDDLQRRVELLEKYVTVLQDFLQHERDLGILK